MLSSIMREIGMVTLVTGVFRYTVGKRNGDTFMDKQMTWKRNIIRFITSQSISLFGSSLVQYAIMWYITLKTASGIMMTISIISGFLPVLLISPFAGVWADRFNRKKLIMLSDSLIATSTLIVAILYLLGYNSLWMLFIVSAIRAVGQGIQTPAIGAILPQLVPEDKLTKVNGINGSIQAFVTLISPIISGALLTVAPIEIIFFVDVITAAIAVTVLFFLRVQPHAKASQQSSINYFKDMKEGFAYIKQNKFVKNFFFFVAIFFIFVAPVAFLTPLQVTRTFGDDVWRLTAIEIIWSLGMMIGGALIASWGGFKNRTHSMIFSSIMMGVSTLALGLIPNFWIYLFVMGIFGLTMPIFNTPSTVLLQEKVDGDYLGRVFSIMGMIQSIMMPFGMLVFGPMADIIPIEIILVITGLILIGMSALLMRNKILIEAGKPIISE
jgi:DHA3 family macrolide efflux protein-like MFS transporter